MGKRRLRVEERVEEIEALEIVASLIQAIALLQHRTDTSQVHMCVESVSRCILNRCFYRRTAIEGINHCADEHTIVCRGTNNVEVMGVLRCILFYSDVYN